MSLKIWLPLITNGINQGASNYAITVPSGVSFSTDGKLGKCASATASSNITITVSDLATVFGSGKQYSVACWVKLTGLTSTNGWFIKIGSNSCGLWWAKSVARWVWNENDGGKRCANETVSGDYNNWYHLCIVVDKSVSGTITTTQYVNGVLADGYPGSTFTEPSTKPTGTTITIDPYIASVNDVRIYDHALSKAEVHELSQGLVCHYKLDDIVNPNLLTDNVNTIGVWTQDGCTATLDNGAIKVVVTSDSGNRRIYRSVSNVWTPANSTYTVSFDARASTNGLVIDASRSNITTDMVSFSLDTTWKHYEGQIINTAVADGGTLSIRCTTNGGTFWIKNVKLERGTVDTGFNYSNYTQSNIIDSSGYGYHGSPVGTPSLSISSPRYSSCTSFNGTDSCIDCGCAFIIQKAPEVTFSCWVYSDNWNNSKDKYYLSSQESGGILLRSLSTNNVRARIHAYTASDFSTSAYIDADYSQSSAGIGSSGWHMLTGVYTTSALKLYVDGVLRKTTTTTTYGAHFNTSASMWIGAEANGGHTYIYPCACSVSDVRIYYTALSADDVLALYQTEAKVDNGDTIHSREFIESDSEHITNNGQITGHSMMELCPNLHYDKNVYVEPDGSKWVHIAHHNNPNGGLFASSSLTWSKGVYESADRWYDAEQTVGQSTEYEFMVKQATTNTASQVKYRWIQTVSMLTATYNDVAPSAVTRITTSGYTDGGFGGVYIKNGNARLCIANSTSSNWFGAVGSWTAHQSGIPGYPNTTITTGYIDLYLRIDNFPSLCAKIIKNQGFYGDNLIEM